MASRALVREKAADVSPNRTYRTSDCRSLRYAKNACSDVATAKPTDSKPAVWRLDDGEACDSACTAMAVETPTAATLQQRHAAMKMERRVDREDPRGSGGSVVDDIGL